MSHFSTRLDILRSLKISAALLVVMLILTVITASLPASWYSEISAKLLAPGYFLALFCLRALTPNPPVAALFILGLVFSLVLCWIAILGLLWVASLRKVPAAAARTGWSALRSTGWALLFRYLGVGFSCALLLLLLSLTGWSVLRYLNAPAYVIAGAVIGSPSHGVGGLWVATVFLVDGLLYGLVSFVAMRSFDYLKQGH